MENSKKIVFVTGGSKGIGKSIAIKLLKNNYDVAIGYNSNKINAEKLAKKYGGIAIKVNVESRQSIKKGIKICKTFFGKDIDILVNNAAHAQEKPFQKISDKDIDKMFSVNLRGPLIFSQEVIPKMIKKKNGKIINIVSVGGQWGGINQIHYAASKAGLINLTMSLAKSFSKYGINVNAISPGLVLSDMSKKEIASKKGIKKIKEIPMGRIAKPEEIADTVNFLCSDNSSYITGQTINVNGGMYFG